MCFGWETHLGHRNKAQDYEKVSEIWKGTTPFRRIMIWRVVARALCQSDWTHALSVIKKLDSEFPVHFVCVFVCIRLIQFKYELGRIDGRQTKTCNGQYTHTSDQKGRYITCAITFISLLLCMLTAIFGISYEHQWNIAAIISRGRYCSVHYTMYE
jgi:hypothetical protein